MALSALKGSSSPETTGVGGFRVWYWGQIEIIVWILSVCSCDTVAAGSGDRLGSISCDPQTAGVQYCQSWPITCAGMLLFREPWSRAGRCDELAEWSVRL